jgi:hypothetical protein
LDRLNLLPCQLAPNAWRTTIACMVMWRVCSRGVDSITVDELLYCYKPCQIAVSPGFWTLNRRQKHLKLVTGLPSSNREWKDKYVFVCGDNWESLPWEKKDNSFIRVCRDWGVPPTSGVCASLRVLSCVYVFWWFLLMSFFSLQRLDVRS